MSSPPLQSLSVRPPVVANNGTDADINDNQTCDHNADLTGDLMGQKSPMCRINEICRYNDVKHEYHLIDESGPAHSKTFAVVLKLGQLEEFRGSGPSIKKAQRSAAALALQETKLKHPPPRPSRHNKSVWPMTPTVELNVLAMKLGQHAVYHVYEPPRHSAPTFSLGPIGAGTATNAYDFRGMHYQRYHLPRGPYCATLTVGNRQFLGKGHTHQAARHAAAEEALKVLRPLVPQTAPTKVEVSDTSLASNEVCDGDNASKSPISLVHEMALKRNMSVRFEVVDESGPSHMPKFVTQCTVGNIVCKGEGNSKKVSKKCAAVQMVEELNKLSPIMDKTEDSQNGDASANGQRSSGRMSRKKIPFKQKKKPPGNFKNVIKDKPTATSPIATELTCASGSDAAVVSPPDSGIGVNETTEMNGTIHPINRLIQLQQARKEKEPQFTLINEQCIDRRRREFTIECTIQMSKCGPSGQVSAVGVGPNKKVAKKNAAESMLQLLGYSSRPQPQSILKQDSNEVQSSAQQKKIRQVKFVEDNSGAPSPQMDSCGPTHLLSSQAKVGRQLVPGLILVPNDVASVGLKSGTNTDANMMSNLKTNSLGGGDTVAAKVQSVSSIAKKFIESEPNFLVNGTTSEDKLLNRSEQLARLAEAVGGHHLQVHYSDFPRKQANGVEYLSVVTITTVWSARPLVSHGSGQTQDEARNQASHQALVQLSQMDGHECSQFA